MTMQIIVITIAIRLIIVAGYISLSNVPNIIYVSVIIIKTKSTPFDNFSGN